MDLAAEEVVVVVVEEEVVVEEAEEGWAGCRWEGLLLSSPAPLPRWEEACRWVGAEEEEVVACTAQLQAREAAWPLPWVQARPTADLQHLYALPLFSLRVVTHRSCSPLLPQYDVVVSQSPSYNTTIYVGNLVPYTTQADLIPLFQGFGYIVEIRMQADRGFAFVKLDTHENAAMAIVNLQGSPVHGRQLKCSWGKATVRLALSCL